jgi:hypothetical protein
MQGVSSPKEGWRVAPPSMRLAVKPHQVFFLAARTDPAAGLVPLLAGVRAFLQSIPSPPPPSPSPEEGRAAAGKECSSTSLSRDPRSRAAAARALPVGGVRLRPGAGPERPSIRGGPAGVPGTLVPYTPRASGTPAIKSLPIERTVPVQVHPAAERRLSPTSRAAHPGGVRAALRPLVIAFALWHLSRFTPLPPRRRVSRVAGPSSPRTTASPSPGPRRAARRARHSATTR